MKNFEEDLKVNQYDLTKELVEHPQKFYSWAKEYVLAQQETQRVKAKLELLQDELSLKMRQDPKRFDLPEKPTEATIKSAINAHKEVKKITEKYMERLGVEKILSKAERAFEHRKKALEGLVSLQLQNYHSEPKVKQEAQQNIERKNILKQIRRKKRG
jgi:hypothetical protein